MSDRYAGRLARARELTAARGAAAALITGLVNVRYLTGLASSNAALLIPADGDPVLATDSRYAPIARRDCPDTELVTDRNTAPALIAVAAARGLTPVAVEEHHLTVEQYRELSGERELTAAGRLVEDIPLRRMVGRAADSIGGILALTGPGGRIVVRT